MPAVRHQDWLNLNSSRNYPLKEDVSRKDITGEFTLPNQLIVDAVFVVNDLAKQFYVKSVFFVEEKIIIDIYDNADVFVSSVTVDTGTHNIYDYYPITGTGQYKYLQGKIVIGDAANIASGLIGKIEFSFAATRFEDTVLMPALRGVSSIGDGANESAKLINDINLVAGFNFRVRVVEEENAIYLDAIEGEGLGPYCPCDEKEDLPPIQTINGIGPNDAGNFNIRGISCIVVSEEDTGISAEDTCSSSCCDCDDINAITALVAGLESQLSSLDGRVGTLESC